MWAVGSQLDRISAQLKSNSITSLFLPSFISINSSNINQLLDALSANTSLEELYLVDHNINKDELKKVGEVIGNHKSLYKVSVGHSKIGECVEELSGLLEGVLKSKSIRVINFSKQSLSGDGLKTIKDVMMVNNGGELHEINLADNQLTKESIPHLIEIINANPQLHTLELGENSFNTVTDELVESLSKSNIKKLVLNNCPIGDHGAVAIAKLMSNNKSLQQILLNNCDIQELGSSHIGNSLVSWKGSVFSASYNSSMFHHLFNDWDQTKLSELHNQGVLSDIESISLKGCMIGDQGLIKIVKGIKHFPRLKVLDLANNKLTAKGIESLESILLGPDSTIKELNISFNHLGKEGQDIIHNWIKSGELVSLDSLYISSIDLEFLDLFEIAKSLGDCNNSIKFLEAMNTIKPKFDEEVEKEENEKEQNDEEDDEDEEETIEDQFFELENTLKEEKSIKIKWM
ncbi:hypothetical protein CYY_004915 [Polysphondylium violaceum]|uniref:Uncharacterized protein n=1 Tax=Polysphondylium violaceum TaxID=133409 RepID=A0A8J4Q4I0_9MYCE|nr:hypothetical protein CYY_004915 [Polysphondylium violaceum]